VEFSAAMIGGVCAGAGCISSGALGVMDAAKKAVKDRGLDSEIEIIPVGCMGACNQGPLLKVDPEDTVYQKVSVERTPVLVERHLQHGAIVDDMLLFSEPGKAASSKVSAELPFYKKQVKIVLENCGEIDSLNIDDYLARDGYRAPAGFLFLTARMKAQNKGAQALKLDGEKFEVRDADGVTFAMPPGNMKLTVCSDSIVRVMYSPTATLPAGQDFVVTNHSWKKTSFKVADSTGELTLTTGKLKVAVDKATGAVAFYDGAGNRLLAEPAAGGKTLTAATVNGESSFQTEQTFISPADEFIYGLGQFQEGIWNWRGMPQQLRQVNTQIAVPMIVSSDGYGLLWNNASLTEFNPADTPVTLTNGSGIYTTGDAGDYVFFVKDGDRRNLIGAQVKIAADMGRRIGHLLSQDGRGDRMPLRRHLGIEAFRTLDVLGLQLSRRDERSFSILPRQACPVI